MNKEGTTKGRRILSDGLLRGTRPVVEWGGYESVLVSPLFRYGFNYPTGSEKAACAILPVLNPLELKEGFLQEDTRRVFHPYG